MPGYIVERHLPHFTGEQLAAAAASAKTATGQMNREGTPVMYLRSFFVPGEDKCFCLFEAPSPKLVSDVNEAAGIPFTRVVEAMDLTP